MSLSSEAVDHIDESIRDKKNSVSSEDRTTKSTSVFIGEDIVDIDANVQHTGVLKKPPFGSKGYGMLTRWTDRFFVVKESFLLYYDKSEKKSYETKKMFNIHPKGVIPLANCTIEKWDETGKVGFKIIHPSFKMGNLVLVARNAEDRDNWVSILQECSKITWNNAQLGAAQIRQLEENTERISKERIEYIEKLAAEAEARKHETGKKEELEQLAKQLEEEKSRVQGIANQFKEEKEMTTQELQDAMDAMKKLDEERRKMDQASRELEENLKKMESEKAQQIEIVKKQEEEKEKLAETSNQLKTHLETVEEHAKRLAHEKRQTEEQLQENEKKAQIFEEEKQMLLRTATQAQISLEEIAVLKEQTELELGKTATILEHEKRERLRLEKKLRLAEDSLKRLDAALKESGLKVSIEIEADVGTLKSFFEDAVADAEHQAKKHLLMEEAVRARKVYEKQAYKKKKTNDDLTTARANMNRIEVDPRLLGESQSTIKTPSPVSKEPPMQLIPEDSTPKEAAEPVTQESLPTDFASEEPVSAAEPMPEEPVIAAEVGAVEDSSVEMVNGDSGVTDGAISPGEIVPEVSDESLENGTAAQETVSPEQAVEEAPAVDDAPAAAQKDEEVVAKTPSSETVDKKCNGEESSQTVEVGEGS